VARAFSQNVGAKNVSLRDTQMVKMRPQLLFFIILQVETFQNASELHSKQLRLWTHKS